MHKGHSTCSSPLWFKTDILFYAFFASTCTQKNKKKRSARSRFFTTRDDLEDDVSREQLSKICHLALLGSIPKKGGGGLTPPPRGRSAPPEVSRPPNSSVVVCQIGGGAPPPRSPPTYATTEGARPGGEVFVWRFWCFVRRTGRAYLLTKFSDRTDSIWRLGYTNRMRGDMRGERAATFTTLKKICMRSGFRTSKNRGGRSVLLSKTAVGIFAQ